MENKWKNSPVTRDGLCLYVGGTAVVGLAERLLQEFLVASCSLQECSSVYEIGFGLGYAAFAISSSPAKRHIIIEANSELAQRAHMEYPNATVINDIWQNYFSDAIQERSVIVYDAMPNDGENLGESFAIRHLVPILQHLTPLLAPGTLIAAIDPSGGLQPIDLVGRSPVTCCVASISVPPDIIPRGLPWFSTGCNIIHIMIK
jgi:hypothetical protein